MSEADFSYATASDAAGLPASISIFSDRPGLRQEIVEDLGKVGFRVAQQGELAQLTCGSAKPLGDVVLLDCPQVDAAIIAALLRLDIRLAQSGCRLVVSTSMEALDVVFACFDQSAPQILVDAGQAERIVAVGRVLGDIAGMRVREFSDDEKLTLLRLSEQVDTIAKRIEMLSPLGPMVESGQDRLGDQRQVFNGAEGAQTGKLMPRRNEPVLPDPILIRQIISQRHMRARFFDPELFADPAWDMLLDLAAAHGEGERVSVTSLCIASGVPATTALRWIRQMTEAGLFKRVEDECDRRRAFIRHSESAADAMARYFAEIDSPIVLAA